MKDVKKLIGYEGTFATRLRELMNNNKITQQDLASALGITRQAISQYADGSVQPNIEKLYKLSDYFKVSADYLLGISEVKTLNIDDQAIAARLGLSDESIYALKDLQKTKVETSEDEENWMMDVYISSIFLELFNFLLKDFNYFDLFIEIIKFSNVSLKIFQAEKLKGPLKTMMQESISNPDLKDLFEGISITDNDEINFTVTPEEAKYAILGKISNELKTFVEKYAQLKIKEFTDGVIREAELLKLDKQGKNK